ncbi:MAG: hypothetical protein ABIS69_00150, partial [Sediminibacterium sp.]
SGAVLSFTGVNQWPGALLLAFVFTLVFSVPGIFIFWIVLLANWSDAILFRIMLRAGFVISGLSSLLLLIVPDNDIKAHFFLLSFCVVVAAIASIMIHHPIIQSINRDKTEYDI